MAKDNNDGWVEWIINGVEKKEETRSSVPPVIAGYYLNDGIYFDMTPFEDEEDNDWD